MPLDTFQKEILSVIKRNRTASSPFAGGAVLQQHGTRLSDDLDIFTEGDPGPIMEHDARALAAAGFTVHETRSRTNFRECRVTRPEDGVATLQWVQALALEYFKPVPDADFGQRLHFADLAANKALAAADRAVMRDFIDLWMLDRHVMPLWRMACAASGKSPDEGPLSLVETIARNRVPAFTRATARSRVLTTVEMPDGEPVTGLRAAMDQAREILPHLPAENLGRLQLDSRGMPVLDPNPVPTGEGSWASPKLGGAMPSFEGMDGEMIENLIAEYGAEGSRHTGQSESSGETENRGSCDDDVDFRV
ncbi:MAG: hypothetical protein F4103_10025 [Boseongicola sp. SB0673_bin_14]|nr:hypothetical protein [Boseongicola sp. SB0667_bin_21]MYI69046.1 hypothetical protein [Boseongicola sp. SB0673_bin_14]